MEAGYWTVVLRAYAFNSREQADAFHSALVSAFCAMPDAEHIGASSYVFFEPDAAPTTPEEAAP